MPVLVEDGAETVASADAEAGGVFSHPGDTRWYLQYLQYLQYSLGQLPATPLAMKHLGTPRPARQLLYVTGWGAPHDGGTM
jgi:hypothetical protein